MKRKILPRAKTRMDLEGNKPRTEEKGKRSPRASKRSDSNPERRKQKAPSVAVAAAAGRRAEASFQAGEVWPVGEEAPGRGAFTRSGHGRRGASEGPEREN